MKRSLSLFAVVFFALSFSLAFSAMAQTAPANPTLTLENYGSGSRISGAPIKSFSMGPDNTLIIYLGGPFTTASPDISVDATAGSYTNLSGVPGLASVTAAQQYAGPSYIITFKVTSTVPGATFAMAVSPEQGVASFDSNTKTFSWDIGGTTPMPSGSYLAVFQATASTSSSQLVVMINIGLTLNVTTTNGTVTKNPDKAVYSSGDSVQLTASNTVAGYSFTNWTGDVSSPPNTTNPITITMNTSKNITANFAQQTCTSTVTAQTSGSGGSSPTPTSYSNVACGSTVGNFTGTITTSNSTAQVSEGTYSCTNGLNWTWSGVTAPLTNGQTKTVTITFTPPGPSTCTSGVDMSADVGRAIRLTQQIYTQAGSPLNAYGYQSPMYYSHTQEYPLSGGVQTVFLADPLGFGLEKSGATMIGISVIDWSQNTGNPITLKVSRLTSSNCFDKDLTTSFIGVQNQYGLWWDKSYSSGQKFLIYVSVPQAMSLSVSWGQ
jgi:hypothetical protein